MKSLLVNKTEKFNKFVVLSDFKQNQQKSRLVSGLVPERIAIDNSASNHKSFFSDCRQAQDEVWHATTVTGASASSISCFCFCDRDCSEKSQNQKHATKSKNPKVEERKLGFFRFWRGDDAVIEAESPSVAQIKRFEN